MIFTNTIITGQKSVRVIKLEDRILENDNMEEVIDQSIISMQIK